MKALGRTILIISGPGSAAGGGAGLRLARSITHPVLDMQAAAASFASGDLAVRLPERAAMELSQLANVFNRMAEGLQAVIGALEERVEERTAELHGHPPFG